MESSIKGLQILEDKWFCMSISARDTHLKEFHRTLLIKDGLIPSKTPQSSVSCSLRVLLVSADIIAADSPVPHSVFNGIWSKASELVHSDGAMAAAPGHQSEARIVKSSSKTGFHLVTPSSGGKFSCDCTKYNSLGVCSHSVAVAEVNGKLWPFVEWYSQ